MAHDFMDMTAGCKAATLSVILSLRKPPHSISIPQLGQNDTPSVFVHTRGMRAVEEGEKGLASAAHGALWAGPLALGQGLGLLANAAHVVGGRAAVAAQQAAALIAQAAHVCVAIPLHANLDRISLRMCPPSVHPL